MIITPVPDFDLKIDAMQRKLARADARIADMTTCALRNIPADWRPGYAWTDDCVMNVLSEYVVEIQDRAARADARIAELERAVTVRDTEIARMETDLELARRDAERLDWFRTLTPHKLARIRAAFMPDSAGDVRATIDTARAGNGGGV